jgi:uncharacterized protein (TIGR02444 family)
LTAWAFATTAWDRPGVAEACLELQDVHRQCVSLLLWRAWAAGEGRAVDEAALERAIDLARRWEQEVVGPMRAARRALASPPLGLAVSADLRARLATIELDAERALLDALEALTPASAGPRADIAGALVELATRWRGDTPSSAVKTLAARLR